ETDSSLSENLKVTTVRFIAHNDCNATLASFGGTTINNLCTLGTIGTTTPDFCLGDEGGPLIQDDRIVGIASWSPRC
ncbi:Trypsin 5G1, partial [Pseudolycoriella hygida]